ncbi:hypothetical protein SAMN04488587_0197 [Methanococcoides vulcani]|uniref:Uncharacterized protein n=1 Tax=Methanococcoides vulcani TaxID=1353158 RepID=A0A1H9Y335_9EURY|nr:hypothetical protein [Methanococcoides vulcani]SES63244.1 hypothetical protein SAMN04488587_0197 [Methanococcoides vulcani]
MESEYIKQYQDTNERFGHLSNYYPFFRIYAYTSKNKLNYDAPYLAIEVLSLLIKKGKLMGRSVMIDEIEEYIKLVLKHICPDLELDSREVTQTILKLLETDRHGKSYCFKHVDPIHNKEDPQYVYLIEYNVKSKGYDISNAGLSFMLSTKELPEESKISVSLLLFKQQIKNRSFVTALNTVMELNLDVIRKKEMKQHLLDKMMYNASDITDDFTVFTQGIFSQLQQEKELFNQVRITLMEFTDGQYDFSNSSTRIDEKDFIILKQISTELERGYNLHSSLLKDYTDLPQEYEKICQIKVNSLFDKKWHFKEVLENNVKNNRPNDAHIISLQPMLKPNVPKFFSLFKAFEPQVISHKKENITETRQEEDWTGIIISGDQYDATLVSNFKTYAYALLNCININSNQTTLETFIEMVDTTYNHEAVRNIDLIPFLLSLNNHEHDEDEYVSSSDKTEAYITRFNFDRINRSDIETRSLMGNTLIWAHQKLDLPYTRLCIQPDPDNSLNIIEDDSRIQISNMTLWLE